MSPASCKRRCLATATGAPASVSPRVRLLAVSSAPCMSSKLTKPELPLPEAVPGRSALPGRAGKPRAVAVAGRNVDGSDAAVHAWRRSGANHPPLVAGRAVWACVATFCRGRFSRSTMSSSSSGSSANCALDGRGPHSTSALASRSARRGCCGFSGRMPAGASSPGGAAPPDGPSTLSMLQELSPPSSPPALKASSTSSRLRDFRRTEAKPGVRSSARNAASSSKSCSSRSAPPLSAACSAGSSPAGTSSSISSCGSISRMVPRSAARSAVLPVSVSSLSRGQLRKAATSSSSLIAFPSISRTSRCSRPQRGERSTTSLKGR
mmetsp:Transcript_12091/g.33089  ORF Transcript_12091/g.33089 Transcript_12091/m.33089 type:complete len:322 (+) Transcript_12091:410-1375(+)